MIPASNEIRIEVSTKCNYNCTICPRDKFTRKKATMSFNLFKHILDKIIGETKQYNVLTFPGMGEPFLDRNLEEKSAYAKKHGFSVLLLTNGSLLTPARFKALEKIGVDSIRVSLYGNSPESYAAMHGVKNPKIFQQVKDNLTRICSIKKKTQILLTYNMVEGCNADNLDGWISYWKDKVDLLEVWRPHNWVNAKEYRDVQASKMITCGRPFNTPLQIQVDGTVNMCCFDFNGELLLGDLKTQSLKEIFESPAYEKIARCHTTGSFKNSGLICENCDQRNKDKSDVMVYNSKFDIKDRVGKVSTTYEKIV